MKKQMKNQPNEEKTFTLENPPGNQWVRIRSGEATSEIHKGNKVPTEWSEGGHIFVKNKETNEWFHFDGKTSLFDKAPQQWSDWAESVWNQGYTSFFTKIRRAIQSRLSRNNRQLDVFDGSNHVEWNKFFKQSNPYGKTRAEIFPNGTGNMSEAEIIDYIQKNNSFLLAGGVDPLEFPEVIDEGLRPLCSTINQTTWGRSADCCPGHPLGEKGHISNGYDQPYLRVFLDLNDPLAKKYVDETEKLTTEWEQKYKNLKIDLSMETISSYKNKPRIVRCMISIKIDPPSKAEKDSYVGSEECRQISSSFFSELEKRISALHSED